MPLAEPSAPIGGPFSRSATVTARSRSRHTEAISEPREATATGLGSRLVGEFYPAPRTSSRKGLPPTVADESGLV